MICDAAGLPLLTQFSEEGFVDLCFRIVELQAEDDMLRLRLRASHDGETVGLQANVARHARPGFTAERELINENVLREGVVFQRTGAESDRLLAVLAREYKAGAYTPRMVDRFSFTAIVLHNAPFDLEREPVRIKCFGCDSDDEVARGLYFESFFNIDISQRLACWNEKDPDYRRPLLEALVANQP